jgi:hypothetical protein
MKWPVHAKLGSGIIALAVGPFVCVGCYNLAHNWKPVDVPIVLKPGEFQSPEFRAELNGRYLLSVVTDQLTGLARDREECMMGVRVPRAVLNCDDVEQTVDFDWQVVSDRGEVLKSGRYSVTSIGPEIGFAEFQGRTGSRQRVVLHIRTDAGEVNNYHPRLKVEIGPENWEVLPYLFFFSEVWALALGTLGLLIIVVPICFKAFKRSRIRGLG